MALGKKAKPARYTKWESRTGKQKKKQRRTYESSDEEENDRDIIYDDSSSSEDESDVCVECKEAYSKIEETEDWIQCVICHKFKDYCDFCGRKQRD
ncbi:hypothetical protein QE152_g24882 [Popillia japonica]|uniref:Uncharacterized protein n=1 Tax=Popillia japonica TaxID=7064 RepID=A0AAW1K3G0_POPJA